MSKSNYPNLELLEYKARLSLTTDKGCQKRYNDARQKNLLAEPEFEAIVFPQWWESTCLAFDVGSEGQPVMSGSMLTKAYTVVLIERMTETYFVFVDDRICYLLDNPPEIFFQDLAKQRMKSLSKARKFYQNEQDS